MKILFSVLIVIFIFSKNISTQEHSLFSDVLKNVVEEGFVNYQQLKENEKFIQYLDQLKNSNPSAMNRDSQLAFWINVYNAFTLKLIIDNYPLESINELHTGGRIIGFLLGKTAWDIEFIDINNRIYSLDDVEHEILRKMKEPRIHFAIVCASISCPPLLNEAYEADLLNDQLDNQAKSFLMDENRNIFNLEKKEANISKIFDWFSEDFGNDEEEVLIYVSNYLPTEFRKNIMTNISDWDISYLEYNWNLNESTKGE